MSKVIDIQLSVLIPDIVVVANSHNDKENVLREAERETFADVAEKVLSEYLGVIEAEHDPVNQAQLSDAIEYFNQFVWAVKCEDGLQKTLSNQVLEDGSPRYEKQSVSNVGQRIKRYMADYYEAPVKSEDESTEILLRVDVSKETIQQAYSRLVKQYEAKAEKLAESLAKQVELVA